MKPCVILSVALTVCFAALPTIADDVTAQTTVDIKDMCCSSCAKKMASKLYTVPNVKKVNYNLKAKQMYITPRAEKTLSPKGVWEAIVAGEYEPVKLSGPSGVFTEKPDF